MVAEPVASPVSSAAFHEPGELTFCRADDIHNVVTFSAPSKSQPGARHSVSLDAQTGEVLCSCKAAECGQRCWHVELVRAAWEGTAAYRQASRLTAAQLVAAGRKAQRMVTVYRRRTWRVLPADAAMLVACRDVWWQRSCPSPQWRSPAAVAEGCTAVEAADDHDLPPAA